SSDLANGALNYFTIPNYSGTGVPPTPQVGRNYLRGPNLLNVDTTIQKSFGLPKMPVFGEGARLTIRGDLFNVFNKLNLTPLSADARDQQISFDGTTSNPLFGVAQSALGGRVVTLQARFEF
ncbi:MAG: hypothetical protein JWP08_3063, partial [Bryobacterales bacterium]|nr:hypothetical protein [Bryobacterales bacterium]